jgi:hypothetical protein
VLTAVLKEEQMLNRIFGDKMIIREFTARRNFFTTFLLLLTALAPAFGQQDALNNLINKFDGSPYNFQEKLFVHIDQTFFLTGETLWFKVYLVDGNSNKLSNLSKVAYLEVIDKNNLVTIKTKISLTDGMGSGSIFLPASLLSGKYNVVAYTRWMRNFNSDFFFHQAIEIVNPFTKLGRFAQSEKPMYDIQFFPEGGNLVAGLKNNIAFRVVGKNGKGIKFKGFLVDPKNDTIARFSPFKFGLGHFSFTPQINQHYRAVVVDSLDQINSKLLQDASEEGYILQATDAKNFVKLEIKSKVKDTLLSRYQQVYVVVRSWNIQRLAQSHALVNGITSLQLDKKIMREGVNKIILFDQNLNPVCERAYFIPPTSRLKIEVETDKPNYKTREKIILNLSSSQTDHSQDANMSVSVYRIDSLAKEEHIGISSYLLLTSELKGTIESPEYYLKGDQPDNQAIDNLMLTHGWSRFKREDNSTNNRLKFTPEYGGHLLTGRVLNLDGLPARGINTYLSIIGKDGRVYVSQSDEQGRVNYDLHNFYGERKIVLQTNNTVDSTYRIELTDDYHDNPMVFDLPEFSLSDKLRRPLTERSLAMQLQYAFASYHQSNNAFAFDTISFYGKPDEKYLLDDFTRFPTMEEVMREYVKGVMVRKRKDKFHFLTLDRANNGLFKEDPLVLLDGVPIFNLNKIMSYDPRKVQKLDVITRQYYLGRKTFNGVVSYTTYRGDLLDYFPEKANVLLVEGLQSKKEFFSPLYETLHQQESRIPDVRHLLLWAPNVKSTGQSKIALECYTSDVAGNYRVVVQALSTDGRSGVAASNFTVTKKK